MSLDEGIIPGGGSALVWCSNILDNIAINDD
jgi:chaperonin GroEL (HSP60 family)